MVAVNAEVLALTEELNELFAAVFALSAERLAVVAENPALAAEALAAFAKLLVLISPAKIRLLLISCYASMIKLT